MPCYYPLQGWRARTPNDSGKYSIVFDMKSGFLDKPMTVPCGQCLGCRLERSRQWACRCVFESQIFGSNCFITLTYDDDNLPYDNSLDVKHFQDFMKRLRFKFQGIDSYVDKDTGKVSFPIRYFHCGEYGELFRRPHYHAILFNFDFDDKELFEVRDSVYLYTSKCLSDLWGFGFCTVGEMTFESAAYVARYCLKKVTGEDAEEHYVYCNEYTGEFFTIKPEYTTMSRRPGIGKLWFDKFSSDVFPRDISMPRPGILCRPPKYFDSLYELTNPYGYVTIKGKRRGKAKLAAPDNTLDRLRVKEKVKLASTRSLLRNLE